ncbi:hypothetical protein [Stenotrophomonas maltophilia]|uniref:hypothetical protein n=1 Tax=Stenotrophomonas maltophilia TaxID=40324 RepID=UPI001EF98EAE|nr:hypothetical protein [Stenotrophomonas maltophilia]
MQALTIRWKRILLCATYPVSGIPSLAKNDGHQWALLNRESTVHRDLVAVSNLGQHPNERTDVHPVLKLHAYRGVLPNYLSFAKSHGQRIHGGNLYSLCRRIGRKFRVEEAWESEDGEVHDFDALIPRQIVFNQGIVGAYEGLFDRFRGGPSMRFSTLYSQRLAAAIQKSAKHSHFELGRKLCTRIAARIWQYESST